MGRLTGERARRWFILVRLIIIGCKRQQIIVRDPHPATGIVGPALRVNESYFLMTHPHLCGWGTCMR